MRKLSLLDMDLKGKRVLVRVDFNVPLNDKGQITDDFRIRCSVPTVEHIVKQGGKAILMAHLGRPKGRDPKCSLKPVAERLQQLMNRPVKFVSDCIGPEAQAAVAALKPGEILMLENVRFYPEEEKNDEAFARKLAALGDVYVNDGFAVSHRAQASVVGVAKFLPSAAGLVVGREIAHLGALLGNPEKPYVAIFGGAKVSDKIPITRNLIGKLDRIIIGGGMCYTFLKAQGVSIGSSKLEAEMVETARQILEEAAAKGVQVFLPVDHVVATELSDTAQTKIVEGNIPDGYMGLDIGPKTVAAFKKALADAKTVVWNGPLGVFEKKPFRSGTKEIAEALAALEATVVVGGGDTAAAVALFGVGDRLTHVSTGGGASVEFLEGKELPGLAILPDK